MFICWLRCVSICVDFVNRGVLERLFIWFVCCGLMLLWVSVVFVVMILFIFDDKVIVVIFDIVFGLRFGVILMNSGGWFGRVLWVEIVWFSKVVSVFVFCRFCSFLVFGDEMLIVRKFVDVLVMLIIVVKFVFLLLLFLFVLIFNLIGMLVGLVVRCLVIVCVL